MSSLAWEGAILAAGAGERFRHAGWPMPKPMVPVAGVPLIEHVIRHFQAARVTSLTIIVNDGERDCVSWVERRFPELSVRWIVETTRSSLESLSRVMATATGRGPMLVSTVDAWCPDRDFVAFVDDASGYPPGATVLAVTPLVADERPLPVTLGDGNRITRIGDPSGTLVTAGIYAVPDRVRRLSPPPHLDRLRDFLRWLVDRGEPVYGVVLPTVVDVDRPEDVALAEGWAAGGNGP